MQTDGGEPAGIEMIATPWSDGVPGVTGNNIKPGCSFVYRWTATQHGAFWYHSHAEGQIDDGLWGPIIIHPKPSAPKPWSLLTGESASLIDAAEKARIPMLLSDWRKLESPDAWEIAQASNIQLLVFDSILINGQGKINCLTPEQQAPLMTPLQSQALNLVPGANLTDKR